MSLTLTDKREIWWDYYCCITGYAPLYLHWIEVHGLPPGGLQKIGHILYPIDRYKSRLADMVLNYTDQLYTASMENN